MIIGKLLGGLLGYSIGGPIMGLIGLLIGHLFDRGYALARLGATPEERQRIQDTFFRTIFSLLGHMAKADGRISEAEIRQTEQFMAQMGLTAEHRREAIRLFKQGAEPDFGLDRTLQEFLSVCGRHPNLVRLLLVYLVNVALADGRLDRAEEQVLRRVAQALGMSAAAFEQLIRMIRAQDAFRSGRPAGADNLETAYQALGVSRDASDGEIKRAYRRLMSEYHPDKLIGQGVPDDMVRQATERTKEIQVAFEAIKKARAG
jgi:DnaJ like chaperone protein